MRWRVGELVAPLGKAILTVFVNDNGTITRKNFKSNKKAQAYIKKNQDKGFTVVYC